MPQSLNQFGSCKMNRNAQRSIRLMEEAYISLLTEKPYEKITVTDVTRQAGLNRGTFYAHFDNMSELTERVMNDLASRLVTLIESEYHGSFLLDPMPALSRVGAFFKENRSLFAKLAGTEGLLMLSSSVAARLERWYNGYVKEHASGDELSDLVLGHFLFAGIAGAYHGWIVGELGDCTIEQVNEELSRSIKAVGMGLSPEFTKGALV